MRLYGLSRIRQLLELIRFSHTLFAMPFALLAAAMAWRANLRSDPPIPFRLRELAGLVVCMVCARSAAMAFNRLADRRLDALNPRTRGRHLPTGALSVTGVAAFTAVCSLGFVAGTLFFLPHNPIPLYAAVPVLLFLFAYSLTKRFTILSHFWLGGALMLAPLGAWVALRAEIAWPPMILGSAVLFWVAGFDMIYACQDVQFDRSTGLFSIPARWGVAAGLKVAALCHAGMLAFLFILPLFYPEFGAIYRAGVAAIAALLVYEHLLVRPTDLSRLNQAFFHVNAVVSVGLFCVGTLDILW
ncbi:MAG: UbiA-like polyprenyltransferase [Thermoguttaceae bacterium]